MDDFFNKKFCDRCGCKLVVRIISKFNEDCICPDCKTNETLHMKYEEASRMELEEIKKGNYNFKGIGKPLDL